jgi:hypothetical protein
MNGSATNGIGFTPTLKKLVNGEVVRGVWRWGAARSRSGGLGRLGNLFLLGRLAGKKN